MLKVALCSALLYGYYLAFLKDRQFHHYNRFYLLAVFLVSWIIPLVKIELKPFDGNSTPVPYQLAEIIADNNSSFEGMAVESQAFFTWDWLPPLIFGIVSFVVLIGVVRSLINIFYLIKRNEVNKFKDLNLVMTDAKGTPYSFFSYIFWNKNLDLDSRIGQQMLAHELVHFRQKHSADKLLIELMMVIGWFNPVFWIVKRELYLIHEFIADNRSIENHDSALLAELLLAAAYPQQRNLLTHPFFFSPIKRRITMLKKNITPRFSYFRRILVIPIVAVLFMLFAFRNSNNNNLALNLDKQYVVVLDAGHGGTDAGAKAATGEKESDMSLQLVQKIVALNKNPMIRFELSRDKDEFVKVTDRTIFANEKKADLFVSVHINASPNKNAKGLELYTPREGSPAYLKSIPLASILNESLANIFSSNAVKTRKMSIWVLDKSTIPAIIVLPGFITNKTDVATIKNKQEEIAAKILSGIERYLTQKEKGFAQLPNSAEWKNAAKLASSAANAKNTPELLGKRIEIVFTDNMTQRDLEEIKIGLKKINIALNFDRLEFKQNNGKLAYIKYSVDCNDGFKGSASLSITKEKKIGFYRDYNKDVNSPFGVGDISE
jgi:N-acetylmuramoyl-L-alanine amidase